MTCLPAASCLAPILLRRKTRSRRETCHVVFLLRLDCASRENARRSYRADRSRDAAPLHLCADGRPRGALRVRPARPRRRQGRPCRCARRELDGHDRDAVRVLPHRRDLGAAQRASHRARTRIYRARRGAETLRPRPRFHVDRRSGRKTRRRGETARGWPSLRERVARRARPTIGTRRSRSRMFPPSCTRPARPAARKAR